MKYIANPVEVDAYVIRSVENATVGISIFIDDGYRPFFVKKIHLEPAMISRYYPVIGDYYVVQADGYSYINPKDVFERKYSLQSVFNKNSLEEAIIEIDKMVESREDVLETSQEKYLEKNIKEFVEKMAESYETQKTFVAGMNVLKNKSHGDEAFARPAHGYDTKEHIQFSGNGAGGLTARAYFAAHAPEEIPAWFSIEEYKISDYPRMENEIHARIIDKFDESYSFDETPNYWDEFNSGVKKYLNKRSDDIRKIQQERKYFAWRWHYAQKMVDIMEGLWA